MIASLNVRQSMSCSSIINAALRVYVIEVNPKVKQSFLDLNPGGVKVERILKWSLLFIGEQKRRGDKLELVKERELTVFLIEREYSFVQMERKMVEIK